MRRLVLLLLVLALPLLGQPPSPGPKPRPSASPSARPKPAASPSAKPRPAASPSAKPAASPSGKPAASPSPRPQSGQPLPVSAYDKSVLAKCVSVPVYVPSYLPAGLTRQEIEGNYNSYQISYGDDEALLWVQGIKRDKPGDIAFKPKQADEVQIRIKHPVLGDGKLCWFPHQEDGLKRRLEYSYGVLTRGGVTYDIGSTGTLAPQEVQKFMQGLVKL